MSEKEINQLVEMGATPAQARAALKKCKDVMDAAERIFSGDFDDVDDEPTQESGSMQVDREVESASQRRVTPPGDEGDAGSGSDGGLDDGEDDDVVDYEDYDEDYDTKAEQGRNGAQDVDPYAGVFFSKDRREEVIEVEEQPETVWVSDLEMSVPLMTQGEWMKGCPEGGEQGFLFQLYSQLCEGHCACPDKCGYEVKTDKGLFFAIHPEFSTYITRLRKEVSSTCPSCKKPFCLACGEPIDLSPRPAHAPPYDALFHCANLQGVILGVGLAMVEKNFAEQAPNPSPSPTPNDAGKKKTLKRKVLDAMYDAGHSEDEDLIYAGGVHKGKKPKGGIGYAGNIKEDLSGQVEALAIQNSKDERIGKLLLEVRNFLPCLQRPGGAQTSDYLVHPTALAYLRRRFNFVSSSLLRNDSLADMSERAVLYFELFEWLETISNHEALASMMAMPIMVVASIKPIKPASDGGPSTRNNVKQPAKRVIRERTVVYEGSSGPRELLEAIVIQAQAAIKGLEGNKTLLQQERKEMTEEEKRVTSDGKDVTNKGKGKESADENDDNRKLRKFCDRILATARAIDRSLRETKGDAFVERLYSSLPSIPARAAGYNANAGPSSAPQIAPEGTDADLKQLYINWATKTRFEYCDLSIPVLGEAALKKNATPGANPLITQMDAVPNYKSAFNNDARILAHSDIPKRSLAIAKELAILTTNLPVAWDSSVFLRVDEARVDLIKALIIGPEGTPYQNGCYLFDIFLPSDYNQRPPQVKYLTTNGGKFRFNPNLYAEGKVCLSLLGTWQGPGWVAGKSTLLQVLISIQSMILCEEPYVNEPGWANSGGSAASQAYSANVRRMVVHTAMLGNLKNPPEPFADIIRTHFRLKSAEISAQLDKWLGMDDGKHTSGHGAEYIGGFATKNAAGGGAAGSGDALKKDCEEMKDMMRELHVSGGAGVGEGEAGPSGSVVEATESGSGDAAEDAIVVD